MVDQINRITPEPNVYRVDETRDALEEETDKGEQPGEEGQESDNFNQMMDESDWKDLFGKSKLWQKDIQVKVDEINRIKLLGVNIKSNPAVLKVRLFFYDGNVIETAFLKIPRAVALKFRDIKSASFIDVNQLTKDPVIRVSVPKNTFQVDEEITRITGAAKEKSLSQRLKGFVAKKKLSGRLGILDPLSKHLDNEVLWIYVTIVVVISAITFGLIYLLS